jgi:hypothetical protein
VRNKGGFLRNIFAVFANSKSWVGYFRENGKQVPAGSTPILTQIKTRRVLVPVNGHNKGMDNQLMASRLNFIYARDYRVTDDLEIVLTNMRNLGN